MNGAWSRVLAIAAAAEAATGLILVASPFAFVQLLFGEEITGTGVVMSRVAGAALIGLGIACWPRNGGSNQAYAGMLAYSVLAAVLLAFVGAGARAGALLWPAVAVHLLLTVALALAWSKQRGAMN